jgi:hypothetical protein
VLYEMKMLPTQGDSPTRPAQAPSYQAQKVQGNRYIGSKPHNGAGSFGTLFWVQGKKSADTAECGKVGY